MSASNPACLRSLKRFGPLLLAILLAAPSNGAEFKPDQLPTGAPVRSETNQGDLIARLEQRIPQIMEEGQVPGLSIGLIRNGELVWHRGFGVKNATSGEPVTDDTVFEAASLSKTVFAYAVLKLVDEGKLDLHKPLFEYLPDNAGLGDDPRFQQITAFHVLTHTTGLPNWRNNTLKIYFTPGERFSYSGEGFVYLSKVVEQITGEKLNDFMTRTVFEPLGMKTSSYLWQTGYDDSGTFYHNTRGEPVGQNKGSPTAANVAASLHTTAQDYGRFVAAVLNGTGLKPETRRLMLTPQVQVREGGSTTTDRPQANPFPEVSWGLGWGLQATRDGLSLWHWGNNPQGKAYVVARDNEKLAVVIFANSVYGLSIVPEIVAEAVGGEQPALTWLRVETYRSPGRLLFKGLVAEGAPRVLPEYLQWRKDQPAAAKLVNEDSMNRFGLDLLRMGRIDDAIEVLKQNVTDYPQSFNVYDSLGEAYAARGDKELAIKNYEHSVELNPRNSDGITALTRLRGDN